MSRDRLALHEIRCACIIGLEEEERREPQMVELSVALTLDTKKAARSQRIVESIDYARVLGTLRFVLVAGRFRLMESAAEALAAWLLVPTEEVSPTEVEIQLRKPFVFQGEAKPELTIRRDRQDFTYVVEDKAFGNVDVIFETEETGIYRERIAPGAVLPTHIHRHLDESELILTPGLLLQGAPIAAGLAHDWPKNFPHGYQNPTATEQSFLCIDRPKFRHDDEIPVAIPNSALTMQPSRLYFRDSET